jgi:hypothetical protein
MKYAKWAVALILMLVLASCAKPPKAEIDAARAAVAKATNDADASTYEADLVRSAKSSLARMDEELAGKRYDSTKTFALEASNSAQRAISEAPAAKLRVKAEAESILASLKASYADADKAIASAKKQRGLKIDLKALSAELAKAEADAAAAKKQLDSGDFLGARDAANAVKAKVADIQKRLADAVQASKKKK